MWQRKRHVRQLTKAELQLYNFLTTREYTQLGHLTKINLLSRRQRAWVNYYLQTRLQMHHARASYYCLQSGRTRGNNRAFRETRMSTRQSLLLNNITTLHPNTS